VTGLHGHLNCTLDPILNFSMISLHYSNKAMSPVYATILLFLYINCIKVRFVFPSF